MRAGDTGIVASVLRDPNGRADRLAALGVTPGAHVTVLQTFPGIVFECDQTELAVERTVARVIMIRHS
jgi:Fe2+ transport system protein FeoA